MQIVDYLKKAKVKCEVKEHKPTFSAQQMAATEHEPGKFVAKPVIVRADDKFVMCVLPACRKIDLQTLKKQLGAKSIELAEEEEVGKLFADCELGAEPPFGNLYDLPTIMDKSLEDDDHIVFQAGSHDKAVKITMADYRKLVNPQILDFSYPMAS
ncbi:MAG: YbaK/EbsC family protein [Sedimentisphaerales bacterium]|jgi:Ala-tRNA(Pro) deacylase